MQAILDFDTALFLLLNSLHTDWLDPIMFWLSKTVVWLPLYLLLAFLIIKNYKKKSWVAFIGIALVILLTDRITSGLMKPFFERLRPSRDPSLEGLVHIVNGYTGGQFGFASSHAANTFGTATFFFLLLRSTYGWIKWLFVWAAVMTYTRIYLGVHYPGDIVAGAAIGLFAGWIGFKFCEFTNSKMVSRSDISIH